MTPARRLAAAAGGIAAIVGATLALRAAWPEQPALPWLPVAAGAGAFLAWVRRLVKPARTGAEETDLP